MGNNPLNHSLDGQMTYKTHQMIDWFHLHHLTQTFSANESEDQDGIMDKFLGSFQSNSSA